MNRETSGGGRLGTQLLAIVMTVWSTHPAGVAEDQGPVGVRTEILLANDFNLIGIELMEPISAEGTLTSIEGLTVQDGLATFSTALEGERKTWILQMTSGAMEGWVVEVEAVESETRLKMADDFGAAGVITGDLYEIRAAKTIGDIFGLNNEAGLMGGHSTDADLIWIPDGRGGFDLYYFEDNFLGREWRGLTGEISSDVPISYTEAFFVQRKADTDLELHITGHVQTRAAIVPLRQGFNFISRVVPFGQTFRTSGLNSQVQGGHHTGDSDLFWVPDGKGGYTLIFKQDFFGSGWFTSAGVSAWDFEWPSGLILQRRGEPANIRIDFAAPW